MDWTVVWLPNAEIELAELWLASIDRETTTAAADQIDQLLRNSPETSGESRAADRRILIIPPLAVIYRVFPTTESSELATCARSSGETGNK